MILVIVSCSSEPEYANLEAHHKTELLQQRYTPLLTGSWHIERVADKQRYFECLTFHADGTMDGMRKWQVRQLISVGGQNQYADWEDVVSLSGVFSGTWRLQWQRDDKGAGHDCILLYATFDRSDSGNVAYGLCSRFNFEDKNLLRLSGLAFSDKDGWTEFRRGEAEPSF